MKLGLPSLAPFCDGHWESLFYLSEPYLAFCGDIRLAEQLDSKLYLETELPWHLEAGFGIPDRQLCFKLAINTQMLWNYQICWPWHRKKFRKQFDRDVQHLVDVVQTIASEIQAITQPSIHS